MMITSKDEEGTSFNSNERKRKLLITEHLPPFL